MTDNPTAGMHEPRERGGDLRRAITLSEPDMRLLVAVARDWLAGRACDAATVCEWDIARAVVDRAEARLSYLSDAARPAHPSTDRHWTRAAKYPDHGTARDVATYHPEGTREEIIQRIHEEAGL